jgi:hypothetical protein
VASPSIQRIERLNYVLAIVATAAGAAITQSSDIVLGLALGGGLTCLNFLVLRKLVVKWTTDAARGETGSAPLLMLPKMVGLMGAIAVCVLFLPIDIVAFAIGYSIFIVSIVIEATASALRSQPVSPSGPVPENDEHDHG